MSRTSDRARFWGRLQHRWWQINRRLFGWVPRLWPKRWRIDL